MSSTSRIRVGIIGASPTRGLARSFASTAHIPALRSLPQFELVAVCTTRQETAEVAAKHFDIPMAFADAASMARHPDIDLVTVSVIVPSHYQPVMAAIDAGKHVYCEWPLGRDSDEAERMRAAARNRGVHHAVGLQGRMAPEINYARDLVAQGYVGRVLAATLIGCKPDWGPVDRAYQADFSNGANLLTITGGHQLDTLCYCLGGFRELTAFVVNQRDRVHAQDVNREVENTSPDQLAVSGITEMGAVVSFQIRGGMTRGTEFLFEIHGDEGDLVLSATKRGSMQRQRLRLQAAQGKAPLADLPIPAEYCWVPASTPAGDPYNVAQLYSRMAEAIQGGRRAYPDFDTAVAHQRLIDTIVRASDSGVRQIA